MQEYEYILQTESLYSSVSTGIYDCVCLYLSLENDSFLHAACIQEPNNRIMGIGKDSVLYCCNGYGTVCPDKIQ